MGYDIRARTNAVIISASRGVKIKENDKTSYTTRTLLMGEQEVISLTENVQLTITGALPKK